MTIETKANRPGWYNDPGGTNAMRWWNGSSWTDHLKQPESTVAYPPPSPDTEWGNDPNAKPLAVAGRRVANWSAWVSFVAGILSICSIFAVAILPHGTYYLPVFGITAIGFGIRAMSGFRRGTVTVLWAPIIGLVLGVIAEFILILGILLAAAAGLGTTGFSAGCGCGTGNSPVSGSAAGGTGTGESVPTASTAVVEPTGSTVSYDMGTGSPEYITPQNGALTQAATAEFQIVGILQADYANGKMGAAADGSWPKSVKINSTGYIVTSDGRDLGQPAEISALLTYKLGANGSYTLEVAVLNSPEVIVYNSATSQYQAWCETTDQTCKTGSPIPPTFSTNGPATNK